MPPKIAHVVTTFLPVNTTAWVSALAEDQQRRGWQVDLIVGRNADSNLLAARRRAGFGVARLASLRKYVHPLQDFKALADLYALLRRRRVDVVHTHLAKAGVLGRLAARMAGVPIIIHSVYGASFASGQPYPRFLAFRGLERLAARCADEFIFVGRELADAYRRHRACAPGRGAVVYYGKDLSAFLETAALTPAERRARRQAAGLTEDTVALGNVSRLVPWKGHLHGLEVVARLKASGLKVKYFIVGDAKTPAEQRFKRRLLAAVHSQSLTQEVVFTGWQPNPAAFYPLFDCYLLTSLPFEGVPGSVIEAVACGLPVLGFDCYGLREIPGIHCQLAPRGDAAALAALVKAEIPRLPELRVTCRLSPADRERLLARFSLGRMVADTAAIYERLLQKRLPELDLGNERPLTRAAA